MPFSWMCSLGGGAKVLARCGGRITAAREKNMLATAFHPEITDDERVHRYFLSMI